MERVHMYLVHIFPAIALYLAQKSTDMYLCTGHWVIFVPIGLVYDIVNYYATI